MKIQQMTRPDPVAMILSAVLAILCVFRVSAKLGISADELGIVIGSIGTIAAAVRMMIGRKRASA